MSDETRERCPGCMLCQFVPNTRKRCDGSGYLRKPDPEPIDVGAMSTSELHRMWLASDEVEEGAVYDEFVLRLKCEDGKPFGPPLLTEAQWAKVEAGVQAARGWPTRGHYLPYREGFSDALREVQRALRGEIDGE